MFHAIDSSTDCQLERSGRSATAYPARPRTWTRFAGLQVRSSVRLQRCKQLAGLPMGCCNKRLRGDNRGARGSTDCVDGRGRSLRGLGDRSIRLDTPRATVRIPLALRCPLI